MSECEKLAQRTEEWNHIYPFMEWLQEQGLFLCRSNTEEDAKARGEKPLKDGSYFLFPYPIPVSKSIEQLLYEYFGVDPSARVETFLNSKVAVAVLRALIQRDMPLPISRIAKDIGSNYITVRRHITVLKDADLVTIVNYGKRTFYKVNKDNKQVSVFKTFLEAWGGM